MKYVEILAGGKGTRMGNTDLPKQFLDLGQKPIIIHTIEQFLINENVDKIIVCCPENWMSYMNDLLKKYSLDNGVIEVVAGGSTRNETIINGCKYIEENYGINDDDVIITHDAVRPFVSQRIINENIEALKKYDAIDTVISATDTIVVSDDGIVINNIPKRDTMFQGQTPQSFNIKKLMGMYNSLTNDELEILTDACKMFTIKGEKVNLVLGDTCNIKITTQFDLKMANAILMDRGNK